MGLALALVTRLALLASIAWIVGLTRPLFEILGHAISWRDLILIGGGLFLLYKGTREIHHRLEDDVEHDEIIAVGMANEFSVMAAAVVIAVLIMLVASGPVSGFVNAHPTVEMLALSFLLLIGMTLVADGAGFHVPKGYIYAAIAFRPRSKL